MRANPVFLLVFAVVVLLSSWASAGNSLHAVASNGRYGIINQFRDRPAPAALDGLSGYINAKGATGNHSQFDETGAFSVGSRFGYIDKDGKYKINAQFERAGTFRIAGVSVMNWLRGYVDRNGRFLRNTAA